MYVILHPSSHNNQLITKTIWLTILQKSKYIKYNCTYKKTEHPPNEIPIK